MGEKLFVECLFCVDKFWVVGVKGDGCNMFGVLLMEFCVFLVMVDIVFDVKISFDVFF